MISPFCDLSRRNAPLHCRSPIFGAPERPRRAPRGRVVSRGLVVAWRSRLSTFILKVTPPAVPIRALRLVLRLGGASLGSRLVCDDQGPVCCSCSTAEHIDADRSPACALARWEA